MEQIAIRRMEPGDYPRVIEVYHSNPQFLRRHLDMDAVDAAFLREEASSMEQMGFLSSVIVDREDQMVQGILEYKPGREVYLSLFMLVRAWQGRGKGREIYFRFEQEMRRQGSTSIRIDVVQDYPDHVGPFWEGLGFRAADTVRLSWGEKTSRAVVMRKPLL